MKFTRKLIERLYPNRSATWTLWCINSNLDPVGHHSFSDYEKWININQRSWALEHIFRYDPNPDYENLKTKELIDKVTFLGLSTMEDFWSLLWCNALSQENIRIHLSEMKLNLNLVKRLIPDFKWQERPDGIFLGIEDKKVFYIYPGSEGLLNAYMSIGVDGICRPRMLLDYLKTSS